jgi:hypothetical protein
VPTSAPEAKEEEEGEEDLDWESLGVSPALTAQFNNSPRPAAAAE